jgi:hypothetical protein
VKKPKWLRWESSDTKSDDLKKVRRQTDQRMKQQAAQKEQDEGREEKITRQVFGTDLNCSESGVGPRPLTCLRP